MLDEVGYRDGAVVEFADEPCVAGDGTVGVEDFEATALGEVGDYVAASRGWSSLPFQETTILAPSIQRVAASERLSRMGLGRSGW